MRRLSGLWHQITAFDNLYRAYRKARRSKASRPEVAQFAFHLAKSLSPLIYTQ